MWNLNRPLCVSGCLLGLVSGCQVMAPWDSADPHAVVARAIEASGGKASLETLAKCHMQTKGTSYEDDNRHVSFDALTWQDVPNRMRQEMRLQRDGKNETIVTIVDGDRGW